MDDEISNFSAITNADPEVARGFLEMSGGNLEAAIQLYFENPDLQRSFGAAGSASVPPSVPSNSRPSGAGSGAQDRPIQIDSDDDDNHMTLDDDDDDDDDIQQGTANAARVARNAQEEEDAAMAKRLQEELYGGGGSGSGAGGAGPGLDDVRSPIRATRETLVDPSGFGGNYDDEEPEDVAAMIQEQIRQRAAARARGRTHEHIQGLLQ